MELSRLREQGFDLPEYGPVDSVVNRLSGSITSSSEWVWCNVDPDTQRNLLQSVAFVGRELILSVDRDNELDSKPSFCEFVSGCSPIIITQRFQTDKGYFTGAEFIKCIRYFDGLRRKLERDTETITYTGLSQFKSEQDLQTITNVFKKSYMITWDV